jgi:predicted Rossmann-fold nucleotide-binding protein
MRSGAMAALDLLFEALTLIQNKMITGFTFVIFDKEYPKDLFEQLNTVIKHESSNQKICHFFL